MSRANAFLGEKELKAKVDAYIIEGQKTQREKDYNDVREHEAKTDPEVANIIKLLKAAGAEKVAAVRNDPQVKAAGADYVSAFLALDHFAGPFAEAAAKKKKDDKGTLTPDDLRAEMDDKQKKTFGALMKSVAERDEALTQVTKKAAAKAGVKDQETQDAISMDVIEREMFNRAWSKRRYRTGPAPEQNDPSPSALLVAPKTPVVKADEKAPSVLAF